MARRPGQPPRRSHALLGLLILACITVITLDARHDSGVSPVDPLRTAVGAVMGPVEDGTAAALSPVTAIPDHFGDVSRLRQRNAALREKVAELKRKQHAARATAHRRTEVAGIATFADRKGWRIVDAQVVGLGPAQSFSHTVTIDAGRTDGVAKDQMVVGADGLVGRVLRASRDSATVLLAVDSESTVGARIGRSMELGLLTGGGDLSDNGRMTLTLVDHSVIPKRGDSVLTWGSKHGVPYLPGVPIGKVVDVHRSRADLTLTAEVRPYVDFSSLDVVGVVTGPRGSTSQLAGGGGR